VETALTARRLGGRIVLSAAGALGMIVGLLVLLNELRAAERTGESLLAGAVGTAGGAALILLPRLRLEPGLPGVATATVTAVVGTAAGLARVVESTGGAFAYLVGRGFPFTVLRRGDTGATPGAAKAAALDHPWNPRWDALVADLAFWALVGVLLAVLAALLRRTIRAAR
jgi:hypothetical protein